MNSYESFQFGQTSNKFFNCLKEIPISVVLITRKAIKKDFFNTFVCDHFVNIIVNHNNMFLSTRLSNNHVAVFVTLMVHGIVDNEFTAIEIVIGSIRLI